MCHCHKGYRLQGSTTCVGKSMHLFHSFVHSLTHSRMFVYSSALFFFFFVLSRALIFLRSFALVFLLVFAHLFARTVSTDLTEILLYSSRSYTVRFLAHVASLRQAYDL